MKVLSIIFGILLALSGIGCMLSPAATFIETGYILAIMLLVYGIIGIIEVIAKRVPKLFLLASIPAFIIGVVSLFISGDTTFIHFIMIYLLAVWFILQGFSSIFMSSRSKYLNPYWFLGVIIGIISIIIGIYTALHPTIGALTIGTLIGIYLLEAGIDLIIVGIIIGKVQNVVEDVAKYADEGKAIDGTYHEVTDSAEDKTEE